MAVYCALALGCSKAADPDQRRLGKARIGILTSFNEQHGTNFSDEDRIRRLIRDEIAPQVAQDQRYRNAKANTPNTAGIELDAALNRAVDPLFLDQTEFYKQFKDNPLFRRAVKELVEKLVDGPSAQIR